MLTASSEWRLRLIEQQAFILACKTKPDDKTKQGNGRRGETEMKIKPPFSQSISPVISVEIRFSTEDAFINSKIEFLIRFGAFFFEEILKHDSGSGSSHPRTIKILFFLSHSVACFEKGEHLLEVLSSGEALVYWQSSCWIFPHFHFSNFSGSSVQCRNDYENFEWWCWKNGHTNVAKRLAVTKGKTMKRKPKW